VSSQDAPHQDLQPRFDAAVDAFGADRLMWGSDFPFVQLNGGQQASLEAVRTFSSALPKEARDAILGGTARRLFRLP
jgi:L-fuconolactonase